MGRLILLQFALFSAVRNSSCNEAFLLFQNYKSWLKSFSTNMSCELIQDFKDFKLSPCKLLDLPSEENRSNYVRRAIEGVIFSLVKPTPLSKPKLVAFSEEVVTEILNLDLKVVKNLDFIDFVTGNLILTSSIPIAHRYGGHQFGYWAMQLGDGRAILLGEINNSNGERWELQLKGAGKTPYSRDGDGRAVLRSSIREFLCSEAMFHLGIPTSRAATIVVSEDKVVRDLMYDGHRQLEPAAVVLRIAQSWFRIGSFEILSKNGEIELLKLLFNFILQEHFPDIEPGKNSVLEFLSRVFRSNSDTLIGWQSVGFTHGVLNTDNVSLLGLTIDYGPFGFMEAYDPLYVPNHSDTEARYCYGRQPEIMMFNLLMLTRALTPIMNEEQIEQSAKLLQYESKYINYKQIEVFSKKLGFNTTQPGLVKNILELLEETNADFVMVFRQLSENTFPQLEKPSSDLWALHTLSKNPDYPEFIKSYSELWNETGFTDSERMSQMCKLNPRYTLRNWMAQEAIREAEKGNYDEVNRLLRVLKKPFTKQEEAEAKGYASKPPSWSKNLQLSCSS